MENPPMVTVSRINIVKTAILPKPIYIFNQFLLKIPITIFSKTEKTIPKFVSETQNTLDIQTEQNNKVRDIID